MSDRPPGRPGGAVRHEIGRTLRLLVALLLLTVLVVMLLDGIGLL
jgi:hypothetical protein